MSVRDELARLRRDESARQMQQKEKENRAKAAVSEGIERRIDEVLECTWRIALPMLEALKKSPVIAFLDELRKVERLCYERGKNEPARLSLGIENKISWPVRDSLELGKRTFRQDLVALSSKNEAGREGSSLSAQGFKALMSSSEEAERFWERVRSALPLPPSVRVFASLEWDGHDELRTHGHGDNAYDYHVTVYKEIRAVLDSEGRVFIGSGYSIGGNECIPADRQAIAGAIAAEYFKNL